MFSEKRRLGKYIAKHRNLDELVLKGIPQLHNILQTMQTYNSLHGDSIRHITRLELSGETLGRQCIRPHLCSSLKSILANKLYVEDIIYRALHLSSCHCIYPLYRTASVGISSQPSRRLDVTSELLRVKG